MAERQRRPASAQTTTQRSRRSRGCGGGTECRQKRMKCDERRPKCSLCASNGSQCTYEKNLFFDVDGHLGSEQGRYRRPILTEEERQLMSKDLLASIGTASPHDLVLAIDTECEAVPPTHDIQVYRGPFGAFRSSQAVRELYTETPETFTGLTGSSAEETFNFESFPVEQLASPNSLALMNTIFEQPDPADVHFPARDPWDLFMEGSRIQEVFDDFPAPEMQRFPIGFASPGGYHSSQARYRRLSWPSSTSYSIPSMTLHDSIVLSEAVPLLKHYQTTVLRSLTPFRHSKTPWHVLFLPQAKNCLAALTLGELVDNAILCSFYGTLAISAFSLSVIFFSTSWKETARTYEQLAGHHIKITLQSAYNVPKRAKYKAVLIALLTMVQLSVISGDSDQTETYFLEAEKFIRLRGLNKKKSRKVRLLHHCYAFERILYESTLIVVPSASHRYSVRQAVETSGTVIIDQDALSFRLGQWTDLEREMLRIKGRDEGENDLHLQNPGFWSATLYPEIFGVPEQTLMMVSLIVRLAKERGGSEQSIGLRLNEFFERAKAIEKLIQRLKQPASGSELDNLQGAMQLALSIYFYRKVYDVDSSILQDKVLGVLQRLAQSQSLQGTESFGAARYIWPAFIAASEASRTDTRSSFSAWFQAAEKQTGLCLFTTTLVKVERVWEAERTSATTHPTAIQAG